MTGRFSCFLFGADTLLLECAGLLLAAGHELRGIVTQSKRVEDWARERGVRTVALASDYRAVLREAPFDYLFAITHLAVLPEDVLALPVRNAINFHDGPLPRYAGSNAPAWAILNGERQYGISWHEMTREVDQGAILKQRVFELSPDETALTLNARNFELAIETFSELLTELAAGTVERREQDLGRTFYGKYQRPPLAGVLDWGLSAVELVATVRALDFGHYDNPLGSAKVLAPGGTFRVVEAIVSSDERAVELGAERAVPGDVLATEDGVSVATSRGVVTLTRLQTLAGVDLDEQVATALGVRRGDRLPVPRAEFVRAVGDELGRLARAEVHWLERLVRTEPAELALLRAAEATPSSAQTDSGWHEYALTVERAALLGDDPASALLGVIGLYLGRTSGKSSFTLGWSAREQRTLHQSLLGLTAPFVPFSFQWRPEQTLAELVDSVRNELAAVTKAGSYWTDLVGRSVPLRGQAALVEGAHGPVLIRLDDEGPPPPLDALPSAVTVVVELGRSGATLRCKRAAFTGRAEWFARQLQTLLDNACADWSTRCADVSLLSRSELLRLSHAQNPVPVPKERSIQQAFAAQVARTPDRIALHSDASSITYAELDARANEMAARLRLRCLGCNDLVGVMLERSVAMVVATLGVLKAGAAYLPLDPAYPSERLRYMLDDARARCVVTQTSLLSLLPKDREVLLAEGGRGPSVAQVEDDTRPEHLAYAIYTSGSEGRPKGVLIEHRNVLNFFAGMDRVVPRDEANIWLAVTSLSFDISVLELLWTLTRGFTVILHRGPEAPTLAPSLAPRSVAFGLFLWGADTRALGNKYELMLNAGRFGDQHGFVSVWTPERHFHAFGGAYPNPAVTGAALAAITQRIQIRAGSCVVPLHHPARVAEEWAVVDNLSNGRAAISFASGWQPDDFVLRPESYPDNKRVMLESIEQVRRLWRGEPVAFAKGPNEWVTVRTEPRPVQAELPFWFTTAGNPESFRIAGASGANLLTHLLGQSLDEVEAKIAVYRAARAAAGYPTDTGVVSLMLHTHVGTDDAEVFERVREPMKEYLRSSLNLLKGFAWAFPAFKKPAQGGVPEIDLDALSADDLEAVLDFACDRYCKDSGLFGSVESCARMVERVSAIGVDEIACLIDFGVPNAEVEEGLVHLATLKRHVEARHPAHCPSEAPPAPRLSLRELIERHAPSHLQCTPSLMRMALLDPELRDAVLGIPHLLLGGEALPVDLAKQLSLRSSGELWNLYGPTETTVWSTSWRVPRDPTEVTLGGPLANTNLYVLDAWRRPLPAGIPGELYIGGAGVARGYHERPQLDDERFLADPFLGSGGRMYRTGDVVVAGVDHELRFLGRVDQQVKVRGYRIDLGEIEAGLLARADVAEAVVVARRDDHGETTLVAYTTGTASAETLRAALRQRLPEFMVPAHIVCLERLPHTPNGKLDKKALPDPTREAGPRAEAIQQPSSELEAKVLDLWREVLGLAEIGVNQNFFDLGGHSLLVVRLHQRLKQEVAPTIPMTALYRAPTIRSFVRTLVDADTSATLDRASERGRQRRTSLSELRARRRSG